MKFIDKYFEKILITIVIAGVVFMVALATYGLWHSRTYPCHETETYQWDTSCKGTTFGKARIPTCEPRYVPVVVCDTP